MHNPGCTWINLNSQNQISKYLINNAHILLDAGQFERDGNIQKFYNQGYFIVCRPLLNKAFACTYVFILASADLLLPTRPLFFFLFSVLMSSFRFASVAP